MELLNKLKRKSKLVSSYATGNYRYFIYKNLPFLMRKHIKEQYEWRLTIMNKGCLINGECLICGCKTPHLQFANKACEGDCYPNMMSKKMWNKIREDALQLGGC